ncbi:2-hydroxyacyl-CoA dehydratase [Catenisphaera adipataccumulans]|uniref:Putative nucleotide-binding protein (Sugar kinase/HSP70/actin superfamily) n=1 Tax=Catenisphaera adipataccumulans TaxID=700500 RepID=A0A7W8FVN8_9FIRM|nr:2-hydroxyacyl-CoA dehydratase [Catenisphaera adipataccumulans]MBB5182411.1 putative nucleotide-binding protein (sugar kinase/HSP70/actin superfamily) [Catenisphaera adipataccumulans]
MYTKFTSDMKADHLILVPSMLPIHFKFFKPIFEKNGYHIEVLDTDNDNIREEGLAHVHNDMCYPALLVIGQFIDALKSGKYDLDHVALAITQTGGGCRASNYLSLLRKALEREGWDYIPVLSLNFSGLEKDSGVEMDLPLIMRTIYGALYGDALMWLKNQVMPYEVHKGETMRVIDEMVDELMVSFENGGYRKSKKIYRDMIDRMKAIERTKEPKIRVGIVGEIYMKYSPLGNQHLEDYLMQEGFEPVLSGVMDFVLYSIENGLIDYKYYHMHSKSWGIYQIAKDVVMRMQKTFRDAVKQDGTFVAPDDFSEVIRAGRPFIDPGVKMGEGWLLTSEVVSLIQSGVTNVIMCQPFGCLPNHIVAKGMTHKIKQEYPNANIAPIDFDPSASHVNQENRIRLMMANAKLNARMQEQN